MGPDDLINDYFFCHILFFAVPVMTLSLNKSDCLWAIQMAKKKKKKNKKLHVTQKVSNNSQQFVLFRKLY